MLSSEPSRIPNGETSTILNEGLCSRCKELATYAELDRIGNGESFNHGEAWQICESATGNSPCPICVFIKSQAPLVIRPGGTRFGVDAVSQVILKREEAPRLGRFEGLSRGLKVVAKTRVGPKIATTSLGDSIFLIATEDDPAASMTTRRPLLAEVASEKAFTLARSWLEMCEEKHPECRSKNFTPELPAYVVDVVPDSATVTARLYKTAVGEKAKYLSLSYCWGDEGQLTTTKENREAHMKSLPVDRLGLTIQDAITTTRRLGFRYLWVDALCIAQDDEAQKASEINTMASIYKHSTAVISAAVASAASEGFLHSRTVPHDDVKFKVRMPNGDIGNLGLVAERQPHSRQPLDSRAWALQEHILCPRKFVFASVELLVECVATTGHRSPLRPSLYSYSEPDLHNRVPSISTWDWKTFDCIRWWGTLLAMYTSRRLTDPEDRLNAFQGISGEIEKQSGKKVRYGIPDFGCEVLDWEAIEPSPSRSPRAPSWSWGCLDTRIWGPRYEDKKDGRAADIRFVDEDPRKVVVTAFVLDGATWDGVHPSVEGSPQAKTDLKDHTKGRYTCWPDLEIGLPDPPKRNYLRLTGAGNLVPRRVAQLYVEHERVLILEGVGHGTYRRTGIYWGGGFVGKWPEERQEVTLV
ncbi:HET-domain-containing protein [Podospora aff. communis PSN243]|uniref:HET-domain-containing protein n=1 Tax=Podospora aff. communis PSN243 TaxID=3040156 RepID=A0AAV9GH52_9PEZI|nr:HET-domain-containing protein [Podospora aff. communis PSN243]